MKQRTDVPEEETILSTRKDTDKLRKDIIDEKLSDWKHVQVQKRQSPDGKTVDFRFTSIPEQVSTQPEQVSTQPEQAPTQPEQVSTQPEQAPTQPEQVSTQPEQAPTQPEQVPIQPEQVPIQPEQVSTQPEQVSTQPEQVSTQPEQVSTQPEQAPTQPEQAPTQPEQVSTQPELTEQQKYNKIVSLLQEVNNSLKMNAAGSYIISANQLVAIDQINQLRSSQTGAGRLPSKSELVDNKYLLEDEISRLKEEIKREKKAKKKLKKLQALEKELASLKNHNNYNYSVANTLEGINQALENGQYRDTPIAFLNERPFIGQLCDNIAQLRQNGAVQLIMPGSQEPIVVMTDQFVASGQDARNGLATCSQKKTPWIAEWISNNTKMSKKQATSMVGTLGVAASIAAIVGIGTWLFTKKDKEGNRSFDFSLGRIGTLAAGLFGLNVGSQMLTGKGPLENLDTFLTTGKTPRSEETYQALDTEGQMGARQSGLQFALLGVPYPQLAEYSSPQTGTVSSIDLQKIRDFHNTRLLAARQAGDTTLTTTINAQLATIEELLRSNTGTQAINTAITNLNLNASDLRNPNNANQTLDSILAKAHENREVWEKFKAEHKLVVVEEKAVEFERRIYLQEKLTEADLQKMQTEGFFAPETSNGLDLRIAQEIETSFNEFAKDPKNEGLKKEVMPDKKIKIISHGKETIFDPQTRTIEGFKNAAGKLICFESINEAMKTALFVNNLKATYRSEIADATQAGPFSLTSGSESIIFKKHNSEPVVMSNLLPFISTMDREFPTIEAENNRKFFVNYLNALWKQDHPR